jgi:hypothetical protein
MKSTQSAVRHTPAPDGQLLPRVSMQASGLVLVRCASKGCPELLLQCIACRLPAVLPAKWYQQQYGVQQSAGAIQFCIPRSAPVCTIH